MSSGDVANSVTPSRSIVRIGSVGQPATPAGSPLGRSGLDLLDVLGSTDSLTVRRAAAPLAMEIGLEQARGALVRQLPGDALAALDAVWEGAQRTEEGWFLRSGSLLVLGLPGECERVAERGLEERPQSTALHFAQSLARLAIGDPAGAQAALQAALQRLPSDPLLLAQQAVVLATQGDAAGAEAALRAAGRRVRADDPAVQYGHDGVRSALRTVASERARQGAVIVERPLSAPVERTVERSDGGTHAPFDERTSARATGQSPLRAESARSGAADARTQHDPILLALLRLGSRVRDLDVASLTREIRVLLRALSAGGTLGTTGRPEQAHAARTLLTIMASVLSGERTDAPPAKRALVSAVLSTLRGGHPDDVARAMRPASANAPVVGESFGQLLRAFVDGAQGTPRDADFRDADFRDGNSDIFPDMRPASDAMTDEGPMHMRAVVQDASHGVIVPVRLGLRLIDETPESRALNAPAFTRVDDRAPDSWQRQSLAGLPAIVDASDVARSSAELNGRGWGAASAGAASSDYARTWSDRSTSVNTRGYIVRMAAVSCIVIAAVAAARGYSAIAVACGIGAAWLALRRSAGAGRRADESWPDTAGRPAVDIEQPPLARDPGETAD